MLPLFGDDTRKKRQINLGGSSSATTQSSILDQAKARRTERDAQRRRYDGAVRVQAWWRGIRQARETRAQLREVFQQDILGLRGLRCLVLMGRDEDALGRWSVEIVAAGDEVLLRPIGGPDSLSWATLLRKISLLLVQSVNYNPQSSHATNHLRVLAVLLSYRATTRVLGPVGATFTSETTSYLLKHGCYRLLTQALAKIPLEAKSTSTSLPHLVLLLTSPLATFSTKSPTPSTELYSMVVADFVRHVLSVPNLAYRLPLPSLTHLSANAPLSSLNVLTSTIATLPETLEGDSSSTALEKQVHLLTNILTFATPRYAKLPGPALNAYLLLLTALLTSIPANMLEAPAATSNVPIIDQWADPDSDPESDTPIIVSVVSSFTAATKTTPRPRIDKRTYTKLESLPSLAHLTALQAASQHASASRPAFFAFLFALTSIWPSRRESILGAIIAATGASIVRELYRGWVRGASLGREAGGLDVFDPAHAPAWPPLILLSDLYTQALLTMSDDEFFSEGTGGARTTAFRLASAPPAAGASATTVPRNPLTLDELISFSRQLLNVAFSLYWRDDPAGPEARVPGMGSAISWETVRERLTKCLHAIHARDSRKPFTPPDHWLVTSEIDVQPFVEAALFEGQQLSETTTNIGRGGRQPSKRQIAAFSPRLGVLNNIPFAIPFDVRVSVFRGWIARDMIERSGGSASGGWTQPDRFARMAHRSTGRARAVVRRGQVAQDGFDRLFDADLKAPVEITFVDQFGNEEAGIDGGGVFKEFFTSLCKEVFDTDRGLWLANKQNELYPNPHSYATEAHSLNWYRFIGRILGKALYEGILVDVAFAGFFLAKWLGKQSFLDDLASLDPDLYQGLIFLKNYAGNPEDLSLNFTIAVEEFGVTQSIDLIPNGSNIPVTRENRLQYIYLMSHYKLTKQIKKQSDAFFEGLSDIIDPKWLRMFNQQELQVLVGGVNAPVDLNDLRRNTQYGGLYDDEHQTVQLFWKVVDSFNQEQRRQLLRFVTSCSRPPLLGFKELVPKFAIRDAGGDEGRLPTSSTCVNLLKLPRYTTEQALRSKLQQAITSNAGFDLS